MPDASDSSIGPRNIVVGQRVDEAKVRRAKELRKLMTPEERTMWNHLRNNRLMGLRPRATTLLSPLPASGRGRKKVNGGCLRPRATTLLSPLPASGRGRKKVNGGCLRPRATTLLSPLPASGRGRGRG